ncbi:hypothetical protein HWC53_gp022 [Bacillus phage vB_BmeM-Goe8]|uniref:DUF1653 domain-containing protein n=1 Tax=Bacillus phage vB_BmeM-Goe8 TaxID=2593638 RepID=A0A516KMK2_9CAUD|nr:hypothetical protein HWC53_gp022 [Bacillus phage vB_BmeM-Goe8]QDP42806.1 hypothetical protein Goe8_c00220 [Bacillus phage vB_BmeM-Goe8]
MRRGDIYIHTASGGLYTYKGIVVPLAPNVPAYTSQTLTCAKHEETEETIYLRRIGTSDAYEGNVDGAAVVYKSHKDGQVWVRPVDKFFGNNDYGARRFMPYNPSEPQ